MTERTFKAGLLAIAALFIVLFVVILAPEVKDLTFGKAVDDMFNTPVNQGVSTDILLTYAALALWVVYEAIIKKVRRGWIALVLGAVGVAVALPAYLIIRMGQVNDSGRS